MDQGGGPPLPPNTAAYLPPPNAGSMPPLPPDAGLLYPPPMGGALLPATGPTPASPVDQMRALMAASGGPAYYPSPDGLSGGGDALGVGAGRMAAAAVAAVAAVGAGEGETSGGTSAGGEGGGAAASRGEGGAASTAGGGRGGTRARTDADRKSRERARVLRNRELARVSNERRKVRWEAGVQGVLEGAERVFCLFVVGMGALSSVSCVVLARKATVRGIGGSVVAMLTGRCEQPCGGTVIAHVGFRETLTF